MQIQNLYGKLVGFNIRKYSIDWDKPSASKLQTKVKVFLKKYWLSHVVCEEMLIPGSRLRIDFINFTKKIAIESDGKQHDEFNKFFHKTRSGWLDHITRDQEKLQWLENNDFKVVQIKSDEVDNLSLKFFEEKLGIKLY